MSRQIHYAGTRAQLYRLIHDFIGGFSSAGGQFAPYVAGIKLRVGMVALACVQEDFVQKANGGAGEDGIQWPALKKETIANRPIGTGDVAGLKTQGITKRSQGSGARRQGPDSLDKLGRLKRGFLTAEQDKRWRMLFATRKAQLMAKHGLSEGAAAGRAASIAWSILKSEGAKTKLEVLGNRKVQIGRNSGRLFNSLSPGTASPEAHPILQQPPDAPEPADRVLREEAGAVIVGSNVEYAKAFHAIRKLWPDGDLPDAWNRRIEAGAKSGVSEALGIILGWG